MRRQNCCVPHNNEMKWIVKGKRNINQTTQTCVWYYYPNPRPTFPHICFKPNFDANHKTQLSLSLSPFESAFLKLRKSQNPFRENKGSELEITLNLKTFSFITRKIWLKVVVTSFDLIQSSYLFDPFNGFWLLDLASCRRQTPIYSSASPSKLPFRLVFLEVPSF